MTNADTIKLRQKIPNQKFDNEFMFKASILIATEKLSKPEFFKILNKELEKLKWDIDFMQYIDNGAGAGFELDEKKINEPITSS